VIWQIYDNEYQKVIKHMVEGFPLEACGLLLGKVDENFIPTGELVKFWPCINAAQSARIYEINSIDQLKASRYCDDNDLSIVGVVHSHTHSRAYPSPTDINLSIDENWLYAIVSLEQDETVMNSFQIKKDTDNDNEKVFEVTCNILL
jgi:[CysO sulfur-carrier protein]-S-L-cysteine hydrolase